MAMSFSGERLYSDVCPRCGGTVANDPIPNTPEGNSARAPVASQGSGTCHHCGSSLPAGSTNFSRANTPLVFPSKPPITTPQSQVTCASLFIVESQRTVRLPAISMVFLGRRDETKHVYPHIDFTHDHGKKCGVSRHHARIHQSDDGIFVEDLDSTNGTYVNDQRLLPFKRYPLGHGDALQLGNLKLTVALSRQD